MEPKETPNPSVPQSDQAQTEHEYELEEQAIAIERASPEGRPGDPGARACGISAVLLIFVALFLIAGIIVAITVRWEIGLAVAGFGIVLLIFNPLLLASTQRASEREEVTHNKP